MSDCIDPVDISDFALRDTNRLQGKIAVSLAQKSPWTNILEGGVLPNVSKVIRSAVQEQAVLASSLVRPTFVDDASVCETSGAQDQVGSTEYQYSLQTYRGKGPKVCVKDGRTAFLDSYARAQDSLQKGVTRLFAADIRSHVLINSGSKLVTDCSLQFEEMIGATEQQALATPFPASLPNGGLSFKLLQWANAFCIEDLMAEPYEMAGGEQASRFICSYEQIERFRDELGVKEDLRAITTGSFKIGKDAISGYRWLGPWRGITFAVDYQPLRYDRLITSDDHTADPTLVVGQPLFIEPEISVNTTTGVAARRNPAWRAAKYEVGFLINKDAFRRLLPDNWTGEATFKFAKQLYSGELNWHYIQDNDCNAWGDTGYHKYQISRAYRPERPHAIMPIAYERCKSGFNIPTCVSSASCI